MPFDLLWSTHQLRNHFSLSFSLPLIHFSLYFMCVLGVICTSLWAPSLGSRESAARNPVHQCVHECVCVCAGVYVCSYVCMYADIVVNCKHVSNKRREM
jgi:hypothetical protein